MNPPPIIIRVSTYTIQSTRVARLPDRPLPYIEPQLATAADRAPVGSGWVHEIKYDGYRLIAEVSGGAVCLLTRHRKDWTDRFPAVANAVSALGLGAAVLDGEVVVLRPDGTSSFQDLQNALSGGRAVLRYCLFDALYVGGADLRDQPLTERKAVLHQVLSTGPASAVLRYTEHVTGNGPEFLRQAREYGLEGIISKRADAPYRPGRSRDWLKIKCSRRQEFVVIGFTDPSGQRPGIGALLLGAYSPERQLVFTGRVGSGFSDRLLAKLRPALAAISCMDCPLAEIPRSVPPRSAHWVEPRLVVEVAFSGWTADGLLRHPSFKGLREDKPPELVQLDRDERNTFAAPPPAQSPQPAAPAQGRSARRGAQPEQFAGVAISNPDKVLYHDTGITKRDVAHYFAAIAHRMLPLIQDRPLMLLRCPTGIGDCFYQKQIESGVPAPVLQVVVGEGAAAGPQAAIDSEEGLLTLVQLGVVEFHAWGARRDDVEAPDRFTIDLDPDPAVRWVRVAQTALQIRNLLLDIGLESYLKTTGGKGLHVVVPLTQRSTWEEVKGFSQAIAASIAASAPGRHTLSLAKSRRTGRILIDYLRNARGATAIEAYSTRARPGAPVALPIPWETLATGIGPAAFNIRNARAFLADLGEDPWRGYAEVSQGITAEMWRALER